MTVVGAVSDKARCEWWDGKQFQERVFNQSSLKPYETPKPITLPGAFPPRRRRP